MPLSYTTEPIIAHFLQSLEGLTKFGMDQSAMDAIAAEVTREYDNGEPVASGEAWERAGGVRWRMPSPNSSAPSGALSRVAKLARAIREVRIRSG